MCALHHSLLLVPQELVALAFAPLLLRLVLVKQDEGLRQEHDGHGQHCEFHQRLSQLHRAVPEGIVVLLAHGHANKGVDDVRRVVDGVCPLVQDHHVHPPEETQHKNHHRNALEDEVRHVLLIEGIAPTQQQTHDHLCHAEKHRQLHLQRVHIQQLVRSSNPCPIEAKGVWARTPGVRHIVRGGELAVPVLVHKTRREELQANGEEVIVHEARKGREDSETQHQVPRREEHRLREAQ
mmetsp:Transcript_144838/g.367564  ORF Transcript_144838/g.367564 Transcript_144838/m.367564 type:complete len:237 (-) Transcript_144838:1389-2099(-)